MTKVRALALLVSSLTLLAACQGGVKRQMSELEDSIESVGEREEPVLATAKLDAFDPEQAAKRHAVGEAHLLTIYPGWAEPAGLRTYVQGILDRVLTSAGHGDVPLKVRISAAQSTEAGATKHGVIHLSLGMLQNLKSEDELAFVLGHEAAHVLLGHHKTSVLDKAAIYSAHIGKLTSVGSMLGPDEGANLDPMIASTAGAMVARDLIAPAWDRSQEAEADRLAADMLVKAGYNVSAYDRVMQILARAERIAGPPEVTLTTVERELVKAARADGKPNAARSTDEGEDDPPQNLTGVIQEAKETGAEALHQLRREHPQPDKRRRELTRYVREFHRDAARPKMTTAAYRQKVDQPSVQQLLTRYEQVREARNAQSNGNPRRAVRLARRAVSGAGRTDPYARAAFATIRREQNRTDKEIANLTYGIEDPHAGLSLYTDLAEAYRRSGRPERAWRVVERARQEFAEPKTLLPHRIRIAVAANRMEVARALNTKCQLALPSVAHRCQRGLKGRSPSES